MRNLTANTTRRTMRLGVAATVACAVFTGATAQAALIGHWTFDEGTGTTAADSSVNGNDATQAGATGSWVTGKIGGAYELGGTNSRFQPAVSTDLQVTGAVSVSAWVNPSATSTFGVIAGIDQTGGTGNDMYALKTNHGSNDQLSWNVIGPGSNVELLSSSNFFGTLGNAGDGWVHVVGVYDPSGGGFAGLYINGSLDTSTTSVPTSIQSKPGTPFRMGRNAANTTGNPFNGAIDDIRVYDEALSASQVAALFGTVPPPPPPAATETFSVSEYHAYSDTAQGAGTISPFAAVFGPIASQDPNPIAETTSLPDYRGLGATPIDGETYFFLEDFTDGQFDTPGIDVTLVSGSSFTERTDNGRNGSQGSGSNTDNVDEDDGDNDDAVSNPRGSLRVNGAHVLRIEFIDDLLDQLPTHVGIVRAETQAATITAFDIDDNILATVTAAATSGFGVGNDHFIGLFVAEGIAYVEISGPGNNEYDHFQYGRLEGSSAIPAPAAVVSGLVMLGGIAARRRRRC